MISVTDYTLILYIQGTWNTTCISVFWILYISQCPQLGSRHTPWWLRNRTSKECVYCYPRMSLPEFHVYIQAGLCTRQGKLEVPAQLFSRHCSRKLAQIRAYMYVCTVVFYNKPKLFFGVVLYMFQLNFIHCRLPLRWHQTIYAAAKSGIFLSKWYQCCRFSRNIAQVTPKIIYFYYQKYIYRIEVSRIILIIF